MHIDLRPRHVLLTLFPFLTVAIVLFLRPFPVTAGERALEEQAAPTDIVLSNNQADENQPAGALVGTLSTVDADPGDTHTYRLIGGQPPTSPLTAIAWRLPRRSILRQKTGTSYGSGPRMQPASLSINPSSLLSPTSMRRPQSKKGQRSPGP